MIYVAVCQLRRHCIRLFSVATTKFSDVPVLPIKIWILLLKKRSFETLKQSCSSGLKFPLSSHKEERPLRFQYVTDAQTARKGLHHTQISWQRVLPFFQMGLLSHMEESIFETHISTVGK